MKNLSKLFIIAVFSIISSYAFSQTDLSNNPIKTGIVTDITPDKKVVISNDDGGVIIAPGGGATVDFLIGDRLSYIVIFSDNFTLIKEIRLIGK